MPWAQTPADAGALQAIRTRILIVPAHAEPLFLLLLKLEYYRMQVAELVPQLAQIVLEREEAGPPPPPAPVKVEKKEQQPPTRPEEARPSEARDGEGAGARGPLIRSRTRRL